MRFRLLARHVVNDELLERGEIIGDLPGDKPIPPGYLATPFMEGLDDEGRRAVTESVLRVYGRHPGVPYNLPTNRPLLDDPPLIRPLDDNQPTPPAPTKA